MLAGAYGAIHNQISYSVSPDYFHAFKFIQFDIDAALQNRVGASLVGWYASWWMGLIIGIPIYLITVFVKGWRPFMQAYLRIAGLVILITFAVGIAALLYSYILISADSLPWWMESRDVSHPIAFARAGTMHNYTYFGGIMGLGIGLFYAAWLVMNSDRKG